MQEPDGVIFEIVRIGTYAKVTAIDARTGREVSAVGPATGHDELLKRTALRKLALALRDRPDRF